MSNRIQNLLCANLFLTLLIAFSTRLNAQVMSLDRSGFDFGYGLDTANKPKNDSVFTFNMLHGSAAFSWVELSFEDNAVIDSALGFSIAKGADIMKFGWKEYRLNSFFAKEKTVTDVEVDKVYQIKFNAQSFYVVIIRVVASNSARSTFKGILLNENGVFEYPVYQSTNSVMNLGDFNCDGKLDFAAWDANSGKSKVSFYTFNINKGFKPFANYYVNLLPLDGFLFQVDFGTSRFPVCNSRR